MEEGVINPKSLEDAVQNALKNYFPPLESGNARVEFYNKFKREADDYDNDFLKKYGGDLDITLIFAALFSAVVSAFIIAIQTQLQPDYTQLSYGLLWMMANSTDRTLSPKPSSDSPWAGPDPNLVHVQAILFSSLAISLLASFVAMLGKQWLNRYSQVDMHGSLIDRSRDRHRKMDGMATWGFKFVMESLPLMLQAALLLFGCALSKYLFTIDNLVALVVVVFTAVGFLFYFIIVFAATLSYDCPFQTPLSLIIRFMARLFKRGKYLERSRRWFLRMFSQKRRLRKQRTGGTYGLAGFGGNKVNEHIPLTGVGPPHTPPMVSGGEADRDGYVLDSNCIAWMFEMSMDPDVILDIMKFIPEITWHNGILTTPLGKLYDIVLECFDYSSGSPVVIPKFRNKAYLTAKALVHLAIQRKCMGNGPDNEVLRSISRRHQIIGYRHYEGDSDLEYALDMIDCVFDGDPEPQMRWDKFSFTSSHHAWMGHVLFYRARYALRNDGTLPDDIKKFVAYSLRLDPPPDAPIISDCLLIIGLALDNQLDNDEHIIYNSRKPLGSQITEIHANLVNTFENIRSTAVDIERASEVMRVIAPLSGVDMATESYGLFRVIMRALVSPACPEEKWKASRLALHWAYKWSEGLPCVQDPEGILAFLSYHLELADRGEDHNEPIQNALRALAYASTLETIEALRGFNPTQPFMRGVCHFAFQDIQSRELRKAALLFLPLIADKLFNHSEPIMKHEEMCDRWASAAGEVWDTDDIREPAPAVLLDMVNSPHWSPLIAPGDTELIEEVSNTGNLEGVTLRSAISRWKRNGSEPEVQKQLEAVTRHEGPSKEVHRRLPASDRVGVGEG